MIISKNRYLMGFSPWNLLILLSLANLTASRDKGLLDLAITHQVKQRAKVGEAIKYEFVLKHFDKSKFDALNISISIIMPPFVKFVSLLQDPASKANYTHHNYRVDMKIPALFIHAEEHFNLTANISDNSLTSGLHFASIVTKISYQKSLISGSSSDYLFQSSYVYDGQFLLDGCLEPLGMENGKIKFYQLSASSALFDLKPEKARYGKDGNAWCSPIKNEKQYIQVFFAKLARITGLSTKGRKLKKMWIKRYTIRYSVDGEQWYNYSENGSPKKFVGNVNRDEEVKHWLLNPFNANYIQIRPLEWEFGICMRFELFGCNIGLEENCISPLGMESGKIPAASFSSYAPPLTGFNTLNFSRLNQVVTTFPYGWMGSPAVDDYFQVDLGSTHEITIIALQGSYNFPTPRYYVKTFRIRYSQDLISWTTIWKGKREKIFNGQQGGNLADIINISPSIKARYIRILPEEVKEEKVLRMELYGCLHEDYSRMAYSTFNLSRRSVLIDDTGAMFVCIYSEKRERSSCKKSPDGKRWISINSNIIAILYQEISSRKLFAVDRYFHNVLSDDGGNKWFSISDNEWEQVVKREKLIRSSSIDDMLSSKTPEYPLIWNTTKDSKWGASSYGIHTWDMRTGEWILSASWKCCGV